MVSLPVLAGLTCVTSIFGISWGKYRQISDSNYPAIVIDEVGRVKTALQEKVFAAWLAAAQRVAFGTLTRLAADTSVHHAPAVVTPLAVEAEAVCSPRTTTGCRALLTGTGDTDCASC